MPVQIIFAGKAHPADEEGKRIIQKIYKYALEQDFGGRIAFFEDYGEQVAQYLVHGVDVWLNNPLPPLEACGTSGMKASVNGVLHLSVLDGWWPEAYNGKNGWAFGGTVPARILTGRMLISCMNCLNRKLFPCIICNLMMGSRIHG